jgi:hypothetical protein
MAVNPKEGQALASTTVPAREQMVGRAGRAGGEDVTNEPGQYPADLFGVALPQGTGAPGTAGSSPTDVAADATNMPGQLDEDFSGLGPNDTAETGSPGTQGVVNASGGDTVTYTPPGYLDGGPFREATAQGHVDGMGDWSQANTDGYAGGPTLPGLEGNRPTSTGAGSGRTLRGGRAVKP